MVHLLRKLREWATKGGRNLPSEECEVGKALRSLCHRLPAPCPINLDGLPVLLSVQPLRYLECSSFISTGYGRFDHIYFDFSQAR